MTGRALRPNNSRPCHARTSARTCPGLAGALLGSLQERSARAAVQFDPRQVAKRATIAERPIPTPVARCVWAIHIRMELPSQPAYGNDRGANGAKMFLFCSESDLYSLDDRPTDDSARRGHWPGGRRGLRRCG